MNRSCQRPIGRAAAAIAALLLLAAPASLARPARKGSDAVPARSRPVIEMSGAYSKVSNRYYAVVTSEKEWERIWVRHSGQAESILAVGGTRFNVDFDRYVVVAVFQGIQPYNLGVVAQSVDETPDRTVLRFTNRWVTTTEDSPAHTGAPYTPFGLFVIPRASKEVVLEEAVYGDKAKSATYTVRATFNLLGGKQQTAP
jgi:hypothetical protein